MQYYTARGSPVFACFLDVAKAFDRVNHCLLFNKLLDTGWPPSIVTRAVLRLECSLDCISGSPTKYFHFLTVSVSFEIKKM